MAIGRLINRGWHNYLRRASGEAQELARELTRALERGEIIVPQVAESRPNIAGGTNHCPNSDHAYSKDAATVPGTLPGTAGDGNHEAYRFFRQAAGANVSTASAGALKSVGHSLYAASEGANAYIPDWDRTNGWARLGSPTTQYDVCVQMLGKVVGPGQRWYFRFLARALDAAVLPDDVQLYAGFWHKAGGTEGWVEGGDFTLSYTIKGTAGATAREYRVLAKTASGVEVLSAVLAVPDSPAVLDFTNYVQLFYDAGPGFIEFHIYRKDGATYTHLYTVRNTVDLQYNDTDNTATHQAAAGWPVVSASKPRAYAETHDLLVGSFGGDWGSNDVTIDVPTTYNSSLTDADGLFFRYGLTAPAGVNRHVGIDRIWLSTTFNEWAPELIRLADGSYAVPSVSPTSGFTGGGGGVLEPPEGGSGGATCVLDTEPVLLPSGAWARYRDVFRGQALRGGLARAPMLVTGKRGGRAAGFYVVTTENGTTLRCTATHRLAASRALDRFVPARELKAGDPVACVVGGRLGMTAVKRVRYVPKLCRVGTFTLRDLSGDRREGDGLYAAGRSKMMDRGLVGHNRKMDQL